MDGGAYCFDDFACQAAAILSGFVVEIVDGDFFEEDSDALDGLSTTWALSGGELEGIGDC